MRLSTTLAIVLVLVLVLGAVSGCTPEGGAGGGDSAGGVEISLYGFVAGTSTQLRADAIAEAIRLEYPEYHVSSMAAGGEARLTSLRVAGDADFFFPTSPRSAELEFQQPLFPDIDFGALTEYRVVAPSSQIVVHLLAGANAPFETPEDLVEQRYPYTVGSGAGVMKLILERMLEYYGSSIDGIGEFGARHEVLSMFSSEGLEALQSGRVEVGLTWLGIPSAPLMGITSGVKMLPISDPGLVEMFVGLGCLPAVIPAGTYPFVDRDVQSVAFPQHLVARADLSEDVVYSVTRAMFEHSDLLIAAHAETARFMTPEAVAEAVALSGQTGVQYHPGALRFYREQGWVK